MFKFKQFYLYILILICCLFNGCTNKTIIQENIKTEELNQVISITKEDLEETQKEFALNSYLNIEKLPTLSIILVKDFIPHYFDWTCNNSKYFEYLSGKEFIIEETEIINEITYTRRITSQNDNILKIYEYIEEEATAYSLSIYNYHKENSYATAEFIEKNLKTQYDITKTNGKYVVTKIYEESI